MSMRTLVLLALLAATSPAASSDLGPVRRDHLDASLVVAQAAVAPGDALQVALRLEHDPHWHTYWINPGDSGLATRLTWTLPAGAEAGPIRWPAPERLPVGPLVNFGYSGTLLLPQEIRLPPDLATGQRFVADVLARWLVCREECIPGEATFRVDLPVEAVPRLDAGAAETVVAALAAEPAMVTLDARFAAVGEDIVVHLPPRDANPGADVVELFPVDATVIANPRGTAVPSVDGGLRVGTPRSDAFVALPPRLELLVVDGRTREAFRVQATAVDALSPGAAPRAAAAGAAGAPVGVFLAAGLGLLGGLLLNLMPCVFPVLALKAMGLAAAGGEGGHARSHGLLYLAGVLVSFAALGGVLVLLRAAGEQLGWGFQLQVPWVVGGLALLMVAVGLSLSGVFEVGGRFMGIGQSLADGGGARGAFFTGVLAVVVATPCTAPFMGPALGFAVTQSTPVALGVFLALGLGLALPLVVLSWWPALARRLPRPGPWMVRFRQAMAFPMYFTAVWLLWVLGRQAGVDALAQALLGVVALAFAAWGSGVDGRWTRRFGTAAGLAAALAAVALLPREGVSGGDPVGASSASATHEPWSPERLASLRAEGRPVLVNMTAAWCITCLANERVALSSTGFSDALRAGDIAYLKGDWTQRDPRITAYLAQYARNGVPLYVVYPRGGGEPEVLPQLLTPALVDAALMRAARG
jgi:thiol:disulfide interchange protein DsbD